ncbi:3'-5' exoribonuclease domain-containing protein, partial [Escherichia coli]|uniref:3'-5' exoribonuclease domain-containing protein n=1 Tax=Escherichia coli TaxID=562 RepID=UPI00396E0D74
LGKAIDFDARTAIPFEGERHNALDDARYQAKYVSVIWQKLIPSQAIFNVQPRSLPTSYSGGDHD